MYVSGSLAALAMNPNNEPDTVVTSVCPGACKSDLARDLIGKSFVQTFALRVFDILFNKPTEQGGWSYVPATSPPVKHMGSCSEQRHWRRESLNFLFKLN